MRVIYSPVKEQQVKCNSCKSIIGYMPNEVEKEYVECPWDESIVGYLESIKCPCCQELIILKNKVY